MSGFLSRRIIITGLLAYAFAWCPKGLSQSTGVLLTSQSPSPSENSQWLGAANFWQITPIDVSSQSDTATPELRAKRNAYLEPLLAAAREFREPSDLRPGTFSNWSDGAVDATVPELSAPAHGVWVIAKFESYHVFAVDPQYRLIYTEINFRVSQVLRQPPSLSFAAGSLLDRQEAGGRIKKPDGIIALFPMHPERRSFQPGGTYLMVGAYDPATEYFQIHNWWDLSSGKVVPGTIVEMDRARKGNSKLTGLATAEAVQYLDSALPESK